MELKIAQTDPEVQGDRSNAGTKPETLGTGLVISVPLFINQGDQVVVNTDNREYVERVRNCRDVACKVSMNKSDSEKY